MDFIKENWLFILIGIILVILIILLIVLSKKKKNQAPAPVKKVEVKEEPKEVKKPAPKAAETKKADSAAAKKPVKYHISQNKDDKSEHFKKWRVRKEGSDKTIKFFDTQKEAIEFAESLADRAGSSVVIHKVDGSIRKQDYTKK